MNFSGLLYLLNMAGATIEGGQARIAELEAHAADLQARIAELEAAAAVPGPDIEEPA